MTTSVLLIALLTSHADRLQVVLEPNSGRSLDRSRPATVLIRNNSRAQVTLYSIGSSLGDPTIWFELTDSGGHTAKASKAMMAYTKNAISFYSVSPGGSESIHLDLTRPGWNSGFSTAIGALRGPLTVRAVLQETGRTYRFPRQAPLRVWDGLVYSNATPLRQ
jgi:hypothetical protein